MLNLKGKRIIITGASSGIGKAISELAANLGAHVIMIGRNSDRLKSIFQSLPGTGHSYYSIDITNYKGVEEIIDSVIHNGGPISGYVHSAGVNITVPFKNSNETLVKEVFETNVFAGFEFARLIAQKKNIDPAGASFVFISSVIGKFGEKGKLAYSASKSALLAGSKSIALELASKKVRCNCVLPGIVLTKMVEHFFDEIPVESKENVIKDHPLGLGKPEDVANLVAFLLSDMASWITGTDYIIDGGYSAK